MNYQEQAMSSIEHFSIDADQYEPLEKHPQFQLTGSGSRNSVHIKNSNCGARFQLNFNDCSDCKVFVGENVKGNIEINFRGDGAIIYIGNNCDLKQLQIRSRQNNDFIAIGEEVSIAGNSIWVSGYGAGQSTPAIIVGDDCMFSYDTIIRNSDGHPIFDNRTNEQINSPSACVHIEPHVWVGERSSILKDTTIGACSIIAAGATVTRSAPRFSVIRGTPAQASPANESYWARDYSQFSIDQARYYRNKFGEPT